MLSTIIRWIAILMLIDSGVALFGLPYWQRLIPEINLEKLALIETALALVLLGLSFML